MSFLSLSSNPCDIISEIFCNKNLYGNVIKSIQKARNAREDLRLYVFYFTNPATGQRIAIKGNRVIQIFENPCGICFCNNVEKAAGLAIINANFFAEVLTSIDKALDKKSEVKLYCKTVYIPKILFPNVPDNRRKITLNGKTILKILFKSLGTSCCATQL